MVFGEGCPEFMAGDPRDKLTLLQDDPGKINRKGWALLERERKLRHPEEAPVEKPKPKKPPKPKPAPKIGDIDPEAAKALKAKYTWDQLGKAAGMHKKGIANSFYYLRISVAAAQRIKETLGADILARKGDTNG